MKLTIFEVPPVIEMVKERFLPANEDLDVHLRAGMTSLAISCPSKADKTLVCDTFCILRTGISVALGMTKV